MKTAERRNAILKLLQNAEEPVAARKLAEIASINIEELAQEMFNAGSNLKGKSAEEILFLDFKQFTVNDTMFGVGQVNSMSAEELKEIKESVKGKEV